MLALHQGPVIGASAALHGHAQPAEAHGSELRAAKRRRLHSLGTRSLVSACSCSARQSPSERGAMCLSQF